ncbi:hypothetical protein ACWGJB_11670 [Streptomyces sp. NPDC054813]
MPEQVAVDFATFALWPIVEAPKLPEDWAEALQRITSEPVARIVMHARVSRHQGSPMTVMQFSRALAAVPVAAGILALLHDLNDPRRGGSALTAVSLAHNGSRPPLGSSAKTLALWTLAAAASGIVGDKADAEVTGFWDWMVANVTDSHHSAGSSHSSGDGPDMSNQGSHHKNNQGEGLVKMIENFFHGN